MFLFELNFLSTKTSKNIIVNRPNIIPIITLVKLLKFKASGIKSKHITDIIKPAAKDNVKLKSLLELFFNKQPIIPPTVVPIVPKNNPIKIVLNILFIINSVPFSQKIVIKIILKKM